jgi:hypothetical protein
MDYLEELVRQIKMRPREQWEHLFNLYGKEDLSSYAEKKGLGVEQAEARRRELFEEALSDKGQSSRLPFE